jgi:CelD/BcsL family acetyltransferase involved in cellulose biosynthesis
MASAAATSPELSVGIETRFDFGGQAYAELFASSSATAFQHPVWLGALHALAAPARQAEQATIVGREGGDGRLRFVIPLIRRNLSGVALLESADLGVSDYAAPVIDRDWLAGFDASTLRPLVKAALPAHDVLRIRPMRAETAPLWTALMGGEPRALDFSAHVVSLPGRHGDWRATLEPGFGRYLERKRKRLFRGGEAEVTALTDAAECAEAIRALARLRAGRFEGDPIQDHAIAAFYAEVASRGAASGFARTYSLRLDSEAIGHTFAISHGGKLHYLLIGCDYERHGKLSPGLVLYDRMIEDWIGEGGSEFDFTIGDEAFKADFGARPSPMQALVAAETLRGRLALAAFEGRARLRGLSAAFSRGKQASAKPKGVAA